jgi:hypothetical protein
MKCKTCDKGWPEVRVDTYLGGLTGPVDLCDGCILADDEQAAPAYDPAAKYVATYRPY